MTIPHLQSFSAVPVVQFISGMTMPAMDLSIQNMYIYGAPQKNRSMYLAVYACVTQIAGVALAYGVGGWLVDHVFLPISEQWQLTFCGFAVNQYHMIILLSCALRLIVALALLRLLPESDKEKGPAALLMGWRKKNRRLENG